MQGEQVRSLVGELRSHMWQSVAKKNVNYLALYNKSLQIHEPKRT